MSRTSVDDRFLNEITRDQHLVIYGSSKQGKSSLIQTALNDDDYVTVQCAADWTKEQLYAAILKELDVQLTDTRSRTKSSSAEVEATATAEIGTPWFAKFTSKITGRTGRGNADTTNEKPIPVDLSSAADIIMILEKIGFDKFIVVEDFHYLSSDVQRQFANDLKTFYERSDSSFIIVGVWLEANRLIVYNGDLASRITSIPADTWTAEDLTKVVKGGEAYLNVKFSDEVASALIDGSQMNVGLLQEATRQMCIQANVFSTSAEGVVFDDPAAVTRAYTYVSEQLATRYANAINKFSEGLRDQVLHMYKWIMHAVIMASPEDRRAGLKTMDIFRHVQTVHPRGSDIYQNSVLNALGNVAKVQSHAQITPIIFDYDESHQRLSIVDNSFLVYLASTPRNDVLRFLADFANERA